MKPELVESGTRTFHTFDAPLSAAQPAATAAKPSLGSIATARRRHWPHPPRSSLSRAELRRIVMEVMG